MSGHWIKMGTDLRTHPKVIRIASALHADRFRVIGGLHAAWCLFDAHSIDGRLVGYSPDVMDDLIGWPGFTSAMMAVDWATYDGDSVALPRFEAHNGASAKRRAMEADRKRSARDGMKTSACDADDRPQKVSPRERGEKEKKHQEQEHSAQPSASRFADFWQAYPRKRGKKPAAAKWKAKGLDPIADSLIADVKTRIASDDRWKRGFIPDPLTYLSQERWDDELKAEVAQPQSQPAMGPPPPSETPLERVINRIRQDFHYEKIDAAERDKRIAEATAEHRRSVSA